MASKKNADAFATLFGVTYSVDYTIEDGNTITLECRALPFTTVTHVIAQLAVSTQGEILRARQSLVSEFAELAPQIAEGEEGWKAVLADRSNIAKLIAMIEPLLTGIMSTTPELTERILRDVIVDIRAEQVRQLPIECGLKILAEVIERTDKDLIVRQAQAVFFGLVEVGTKVLNQGQKKTESESNNSDTPNEKELNESEQPNSS